MNNSQYSVEVLIHGKRAKEYVQYVDGEYKTFIEGRPGTEYSLKINNHSNQKLLAIAAVDSVNVVTGKVSDGYKGRGYIIQPYGSVLIKGYRESDVAVGAFKFTGKHSSYASEKGVERNCGVVAVNLIAEKVQPVKEIHHHHDHYPVPVQPYDPWRPKKYWFGNTVPIGTSSGDSLTGGTYACSNDAGSQTKSFASDAMPIAANGGQHVNSVSRTAGFDLGSTWGDRIEDKITRKHFDKGDIIASFKIHYASRKALELIGIEFHPQKQIDWPQGFEGEYAKPPRNWNS